MAHLTGGVKNQTHGHRLKGSSDENRQRQINITDITERDGEPALASRSPWSRTNYDIYDIGTLNNSQDLSSDIVYETAIKHRQTPSYL